MEKQFTATAYIIKKDHLLLIHHKKFNKWLPPGGHLLPNETPPEAAIREVKEETGLEVQLISDDPLVFERTNSKTLARPYLCHLCHVPAYKDQPAHQHIDFVFLAKPIQGDILYNQEEVFSARWFSLEEILLLKTDQEIFGDTQEIAKRVLKKLPFYTNNDKFIFS